jgi:hypothetical protein
MRRYKILRVDKDYFSGGVEVLVPLLDTSNATLLYDCSAINKQECAHLALDLTPTEFDDGKRESIVSPPSGSYMEPRHPNQRKIEIGSREMTMEDFLGVLLHLFFFANRALHIKSLFALQ